jgi:hypothetical protein
LSQKPCQAFFSILTDFFSEHMTVLLPVLPGSWGARGAKDEAIELSQYGRERLPFGGGGAGHGFLLGLVSGQREWVRFPALQTGDFRTVVIGDLYKSVLLGEHHEKSHVVPDRNPVFVAQAHWPHRT